MTVADVLQFRPSVGRPWPRWGGVYVGELNGSSLVMGPFTPDELTWSDADSWARALHVGAHADFRLPTVAELVMIVRVMRSQIAVARLWSCDLGPDVPADACTYDMIFDHPGTWGRHFRNYAIAVRRERP